MARLAQIGRSLQGLVACCLDLAGKVRTVPSRQVEPKQCKLAPKDRLLRSCFAIPKLNHQRLKKKSLAFPVKNLVPLSKFNQYDT